MLIRRDDFKLLDKIVLGNAQFKPPFKAGLSMTGEARFVHIVHGHTILYAPTKKFELHTGDSVIMKCENFLNNWLENENGENSEVIVLPLYPEVIKYVYDDQIPTLFSTKNEDRTTPAERIEENDMMRNYIASLRYYLNNKSFINEALLKVKIQELILILYNSDTTGKIKAILADLFQSQEYEFKEIIHSNLYEDLKIEDLAFFAGMSLSSFKRKFKSVYQTSPTKYIRTKRLEKAQNLLQTTNLRVSDVAYDCGFNATGYFSKTFLAAFDMSPSEYRKQYQAS